MPKNVTIQLREPIVGHEGMIRSVVLRPPRFEDYLTIGEPFSVGESPDGARFAVENQASIRAYLTVCLVEPTEIMLTQATVHDARAVKRAILDFFQDDAEEGAKEGSKTSQMNSSSNSNSTPASSGT